MKKTLVGPMLGLWLSGVFGASLLSRIDSAGSTTAAKVDVTRAILALAVALLWPLGYFLISRNRFVPRRLPGDSQIAILLFGLSCGLSAFVSPAIYESTGYVVLTLMTMLIALQFNSNLSTGDYVSGLKIYAVLIAGMLVWFSVFDYVPGTRLGNGKEILNPNTVALVAMSGALSALAFNSSIVRTGIILPMTVIIVLTGSRASALATLAAISIAAYSRLHNWRSLITPSTLLMSVLLLAAGLYYADNIVQGASNFFAFEDKYRGAGTGATGRSLAWKETWNLFLSNPALGVGFRAHERLLKSGSSAHNGYLATLAEIGLIGFTCFMYIILKGVKRLWRHTHQPHLASAYSLSLGLACGYLLVAMFERYLVNVGNPTSLLFLLAILLPATGMTAPPPHSPPNNAIGDTQT